MSTYYIGADVHSNSTELAIEKKGEIVAQYTVPTSIPAIAHVLDSIQGKKCLAVEEGPMSGWLYRNLHDKLEQFMSSDLLCLNNLHGLLLYEYVPDRWLATFCVCPKSEAEN